MKCEKKNIYPQVILSDSEICGFEVKDGESIFHFPEGYFIAADERTKPNAQIVIPCDISDSIEVCIAKRMRIFGRKSPVYWYKKYCTVKQLQKFLVKNRLIIIEEFYTGQSSVCWRGDIQTGRYYPRHGDNFFEIRIYLDDDIPIIYRYEV